MSKLKSQPLSWHFLIKTNKQKISWTYSHTWTFCLSPQSLLPLIFCNHYLPITILTFAQTYMLNFIFQVNHFQNLNSTAAFKYLHSFLKRSLRCTKTKFPFRFPVPWFLQYLFVYCWKCNLTLHIYIYICIQNPATKFLSVTLSASSTSCIALAFIYLNIYL